MSYQKQTFTGGAVFIAAELAHIEAGVAANDAKAAELTARANALAAALDDLTGWTQYTVTKAGKIFTGLALQNGETLRIRNVTITGENNATLESFKVWGYVSSDVSVDTHSQIIYKSAQQLSAASEISVTVETDYPRIAIIAEPSGTTFTTSFEYKIVPVASAGQSAAGTYTAHDFHDGNDLYPDELDDMEDQIAADDAALAALKTRLDTAAATVDELIPWSTFNQTFSGSKLMEVPVIAGQTLKIRNLSISLANDATPTAFIVKGCNSSSYSTDPGTQLTRKATFEDFQLVLEASYSYLRVNAIVPNDEEQTVSFEYKIV